MRKQPQAIISYPYMGGICKPLRERPEELKELR